MFVLISKVNDKLCISLLMLFSNYCFFFEYLNNGSVIFGLLQSDYGMGNLGAGLL